MDRMPDQMLEPGVRLLADLYSARGVKLLPAGTVLTPEMCRSIRRTHKRGVFFTRRGGSARGYTHERFGALARPGRGGVLLNGEGSLWKVPDINDERRQRARILRSAETYALERSQKWAALPRRIEPIAAPPPPMDDFYALPDPEALRAERGELFGVFSDHWSRLQRTGPCDAEGLIELGERVSARCAESGACFGMLVMPEGMPASFIVEHGFSSGLLAGAIATRLRWSRDEVVLATLAGWLADVGMEVIPPEVLLSSGPLGEFEFNRIRRHPMISVALLEGVQGLPEAVRLAAYQHHEREDGRGYPAAVRGGRIADLSRVVGVAHAYAAAIAHRPYRFKKRPHDAIAELVRLAARGTLHRRTVRALIEAIGLFPVGSFVRLTDGRAARVLSCNPESPDRPLLAPVTAPHWEEQLDRCIDLALVPRTTLAVARAIDRPGAFTTTRRGAPAPERLSDAFAPVPIAA